ncbi:hypothetical protein GUJ93_ZPchr0014g47045 [Zizania palustris]|uniref:Uncharacterized protein n=1 Tax=Zizania palustris TaxID=103762 RepID=A0A8J5SW96_ZIZPA|nr:hypothetical protein GUJ93_ZPchr0014g47045 [Zizania palustris]
MATRKKLHRKFRLRGITLKEVATFLARLSYAEDNALDLLLDELDKESCQVNQGGGGGRRGVSDGHQLMLGIAGGGLVHHPTVPLRSNQIWRIMLKKLSL